MDAVLSLFATNAAIILGVLILLWLISVAIKDVSFIDAFWGFSFVIIAAVTYLLTEGGSEERRLLILCITAVWGTRLAAYLVWRWRLEGPDGRYLAMLGKAEPHPHRFSFRMVFMLQGVLLLIVSLPIQLGSIPAEPAAVGVIGWIGAGLAIIGILSSLFIVDEREKALVLQFGQIKAVKEEPGLAFKLPLIQEVVRYDGRILSLTARSATGLPPCSIARNVSSRWVRRVGSSS